MGKFLWGVVAGMALMYVPLHFTRVLYEQNIERGYIGQRLKEEIPLKAGATFSLYYPDGTNYWETIFEPISEESLQSNKTRTAKDAKRWKFTINSSLLRNPLTGDASKFKVDEVTGDFIYNPASLKDSPRNLKPTPSLKNIIN